VNDIEPTTGLAVSEMQGRASLHTRPLLRRVSSPTGQPVGELHCPVLSRVYHGGEAAGSQRGFCGGGPVEREEQLRSELSWLAKYRDLRETDKTAAGLFRRDTSPGKAIRLSSLGTPRALAPHLLQAWYQSANHPWLHACEPTR
jgi:hypothetical protein